MKDTQKILRHSFFNLVEGHISYDGNTISTYDEMNDRDDVYILLSTQQEVFDETTDTFITRSSLTFEIVAKTGTTVSKDVIDDITDQIYSLLRPTPTTIGLVAPAGFQFQNVYRENAITQVLQISTTQSILRKLVTIVVTIVEQ